MRSGTPRRKTRVCSCVKYNRHCIVQVTGGTRKALSITEVTNNEMLNMSSTGMPSNELSSKERSSIIIGTLHDLTHFNVA